MEPEPMAGVTDLEIALLTIGELELKRRKASMLLHARDEQIMELERRLAEHQDEDTSGRVNGERG